MITETINAVQLRAARIARLNDLLRTTFLFGKVHMTVGLAAMGPDFVSATIEAVQSFSNWEEGNDPYGEHDFGTAEVEEIEEATS